MDEMRATRRRYRFFLRTLFVLVTLASLLLGLRFGWRPHWIAERQAYLAGLNVEWADGPVGMRTSTVSDVRAVTPSAGHWSKTALWFYGETPHSQIRVPVRIVGRKSSRDAMTSYPLVQEAASIFPEATIYAVPLPWYASALPASRQRTNPNSIITGRPLSR